MTGPQRTAPDLQNLAPPDGCIPVEMPFSLLEGSSFVEGDPTGDRLRIRMFMRESDNRLISKVWFGPQSEGPPGHAHGGAGAAVLDHTMGVVTWLAGYAVLGARITINYHRKVPLGEVMTVETWVDGREGKKVTTAGRVYASDPEDPYTTGSGLYIMQPIEKFAPVESHGAALKSHMRGGPVELGD